MKVGKSLIPFNVEEERTGHNFGIFFQKTSYFFHKVTNLLHGLRFKINDSKKRYFLVVG